MDCAQRVVLFVGVMGNDNRFDEIERHAAHVKIQFQRVLQTFSRFVFRVVEDSNAHSFAILASLFGLLFIALAPPNAPVAHAATTTIYDWAWE
jgi:hypothetical protein